MRPASSQRRRLRALRAPLLALLWAAAAGCATVPESGDRRALRRIPEVPEAPVRADRALVAAFFGAGGAPLSAAQLERIVPAAAPQGGVVRSALREAAAKKGRLLLAVKADERFLWEELAHNHVLLLRLPPDVHYGPADTLLIPVAWDRRRRIVELLDGNGEIHPLSEDLFFSRREPLKHAALRLVKPGALGGPEPTRAQKLLLADFWYDRGDYRRAEAAYASVQAAAPVGAADLDALLGQGNSLVRRSRYQDAVPVFRAALARAPDDPRVLNNLAYCMLRATNENLLVALRHATKADKLDPENPVVLETLGSLNLRIGDAPAAARYFERAWARALKRAPEVQVAILDQLVRAWLACDRGDLAWQVAEHRRRAFPEFKFPPDLLRYFPALKRAPEPLPEKK